MPPPSHLPSKTSPVGSLHGIPIEEWERIEREEHDIEHAGRLAFNFGSCLVNVPHVLWWEDYCYKPGRQEDRGHLIKKLFEAVAIHDLKGKRLLDVGCGNGQYAVFFALMGAEVWAFDLSPVGIALGRRMSEVNGVADRCRFSVQNASSMSYSDNFFDIVVFNAVLHHAIKYPGVGLESRRVLKPGGRVVCVEGLRGNPLLEIGRKFTMRGKENLGDVLLEPEHIRHFSEGFSSCRVEAFSLLFMVKRLFRRWVGWAPVRWFLWATKKADDLLLKCFPFLRRYCGECVIELVK